jgi:hypothetical protein
MLRSAKKSTLVTSSYLVHLKTVALEYGITLEVETDFDHYLCLCDQLDKKSPGTTHSVSYQFNPAYSQLDENTAVWIKGTNRDGEVVHVQALKIADLTHSSVDEYLSSMDVYFKDPDRMRRDGASCNVYAPNAKKMNGIVCYHGEIWLRRDFRGNGLAGILPRFAVALAHSLWSPDYIIGLVTDGLLKKGIAAQYGYFQGQEYVTFDVPEDNIHLNEWLIWVTRQTYTQMVRQLPSETEYTVLKAEKLAS